MLDSCEVKPTSQIQEQETYFDSSVLLVHKRVFVPKEGGDFSLHNVLDWYVGRLCCCLGSFLQAWLVTLTVDGHVLVLQELHLSRASQCELSYKSLFVLHGVHT